MKVIFFAVFFCVISSVGIAKDEKSQLRFKKVIEGTLYKKPSCKNIPPKPDVKTAPIVELLRWDECADTKYKSKDSVFIPINDESKAVLQAAYDSSDISDPDYLTEVELGNMLVHSKHLVIKVVP